MSSVWISSTSTQARYNVPGELMYGNGRAVWIPATLSQSGGDGTSTYALDWDASVKVKVKESDVLPRGFDENTHPDDIVQLEFPNEGSVLFAIGERFRQAQPVMRLGRNFIYINPVNRLYREHGSHKNAMTDMYNDGSTNEVDMYSVAEQAHRMASQNLMNQTIILRGCSGSGKTELSKYIIQYLLFAESPCMDPAVTENPVYVCLGHAANPLLFQDSPTAKGTAASMLILDAFGSAPTEKCPTSSRLVRKSRLQYDMRGKLCGVSQSYMLLDQTRILAQNIAESHPFHIFAWIAVGSDDAVKNELNITSSLISDFMAHDIASSPTYVEDMQSNLQHLRRLLCEMGMSDDIWNSVIRILVAVMHLQRLAVSGSDAATISAATKSHVAYAEAALQMEMGTLGPVLLKKKMDIGGSVSYKNLTQEDAKGAIFCLGAELYKVVFDYLLGFCAAFSSGGSKETSGPVIQIADVGGNESQSTPPNSLSQFCVNLLEEKMNQHLLQRAFQREIEFLKKEGVPAPEAGVIADPEPILNLLEYPPTGIISLIEEASLFPRGNDNALLDKIFSTHSKGKLVKTAGRGAKTSFVVKHNFGDVQYDIDGFVAANKMKINADGKALIKTLVSEKFQFLGNSSEEEAAEDTSASTKGRRVMDKNAVKAAFIANVCRDKSTELLNGFGGSEIEGDADPLFVFCIRGSLDLRSFTFDPSHAQPQVSFLNLPEMATFSKRGFSSRQLYKEFYERYRVMFSYKFDGLPWKMPSDGDPKVLVRGLMRECASLACEPGLAEDDPIAPVLGKTFVFLKQKTVELLEITRSDVLRKYAQAVVLIQAGSRMKLAKKKYNTLSRGIIMAQNAYRAWRCVKSYRNYLNSARRIQGFHRMKKLSQRFKETKNAVMVIKRRLLDKMILRIRYKKLQRATRALHFLSRGFVIRQQINRVLRAVLVLQNLAKDFLKRNRLFYYRKIAVVLIQKVFRGIYVRHLNRPIVRALKIRRNQRIGTAAVKRLQSLWRMKRVYGRFKEILKAATYIQCWSKARKEREIYLKKLVVVKWLQCLTRKIVATNYTHSLRVDEMLREEVETLSRVRENELRVVNYKEMSTDQFPSSRIGGGYYKNAREKYGRYLVGLDVNFDLSIAYPKGWVNSIMKFDEGLRSSGQKRLNMIAAGKNHTVLVDTYSNVFTFGLGDNGQLGHGGLGNEVEPRSLDTLGYQAAAAEGRGISRHVSQKVEVVAIAAGRDHTLLLTGSRRVYSWGSNRRGQLGHSNFKSSSLPRLVQGPINVKVIACGSYHSTCLADPGILHCWGAKECLGRRAESDCSEAQTLPFFLKRRVQLLVSGETHVTVRAGSDFYSWGLNTYGQLGRGAPPGAEDTAGIEEKSALGGSDSDSEFSETGMEDTSSIASFAPKSLLPPKTKPRKVGDSAVPVRVNLPSHEWSEGDLMGCTLVSGSRHMLLALKSRVWAWGWNRYGQVGNGSLADAFSPVQIPVNGPKSSLALKIGTDKVSKKVGTSAVRVKNLIAGWRHSMIVTQGGVVYVWGMPGLHCSNVCLMPSPKTSSSEGTEKENSKSVRVEDNGGAEHKGNENAPTPNKPYDPNEPVVVLKCDDPDAVVLVEPHMVELPLRMQPHDVLGVFSCSNSSFSMSAVELLEKDEPVTPVFKAKYKSNRHTESLLFHNSATMQREISERQRKELGGWSRAAFQSTSKGPRKPDGDSMSVSSTSSSPIVPKTWGDRTIAATPKPSSTVSMGATSTRRNRLRSTSNVSVSSEQDANLSRSERVSKEGELTHEGLLDLFSPVKRPVSYNYAGDSSIDMDSYFNVPDDESENSSANKQSSIAQVRKEAEARRRMSFHSSTGTPGTGGGPDRRNTSLASKARKRRSSVATLRRSDIEESLGDSVSPPPRQRGSPLLAKGSTPPPSGSSTLRPQLGQSPSPARSSLAGAFPTASSQTPSSTSPSLPEQRGGRSKKAVYPGEDNDMNSLQNSVQSLKNGKSRVRKLAGSSPQRRVPVDNASSGTGGNGDGESLGLNMIAVSDLAAMIQSIKKESLQEMSMSWRQN